MKETRHLLAKRRRRAHSAGVTTLLIRCTRMSPESNRGARQAALVGLRRGHAGPDAGDAAVRHPRPRRCRDPLAARHGDHPRLAGRRPAHDRRARTSPHPARSGCRGGHRATTTGRLPLCGLDEPTRYSSKARSHSIGIGSASWRLPPSTSSLQSTSGVWQRYLRARAGLRAHLIIPCSDQATLVPWPFGGTVGRPIASRWWPAHRLETPPARRASQRQAVEALDDG